MGYRWLATAALALHFGYIAYLGLGGFLVWRWPKMIYPHLVAGIWGLLIAAGWVNCPLTWVEDRAREKAGLTRLTQGFVDRYLDNVIYPAQYVNVARLGLALLIAISYVGAYAFWRRRHAIASDSDTTAKSGERDSSAATV
jgi:hypothetical protein